MGFLLALQQINGIIWAVSPYNPRNIICAPFTKPSFFAALYKAAPFPCSWPSLLAGRFILGTLPLRSLFSHYSDWAALRVSGWAPSCWHLGQRALALEPWGLGMTPLRHVTLRKLPPHRPESQRPGLRQRRSGICPRGLLWTLAGHCSYSPSGAVCTVQICKNVHCCDNLEILLAQIFYNSKQCSLVVDILLFLYAKHISNPLPCAPSLR